MLIHTQCANFIQLEFSFLKYKLGLKYLAMESVVAFFNVVYTCCTASYKAVSGLIEMLGFDEGENLFILIFIKPLQLVQVGTL